MAWLRGLLVRLTGWFGKAGREAEWSAEFESHLQLHIDEKVRAGMSAAEARRQALLALGGVASLQDSMRDASTLVWLETTVQDLRYALRGIGRNPGFAATVIVSLTLGIGAGLAIFTVADTLLLRPLPYRDPHRLVMVYEKHRLRTKQDHNVVSPANYLDWRRQNDVFEEMAAYCDVRTVLTAGPRSEELEQEYVSAELHPMLGVKPFRGRLFTKQDDAPRAPNVEIISYRLWQSWFNGDESVIGRKVLVNSAPATIVGVLPPDFSFSSRTIDLWEPIGLDPARDYRKASGRWMWSLARMKPGVTRDEAQAHMAALAQRLEAAYPAFDTNWTVNVELLRDSMVRNVRTSLLILLGAVALLLAVACANVANLLLARYSTRQREMALRVSLGAGRSRIVRQLLTESLLLGLAGGLLGLLAAQSAVKVLMLLAPQSLSQGIEIVMDLRIVWVALAVSVTTGILFGLAPALVTARSRLAATLHQENRSTIGGAGRLRSWLVGAEVALSVILLTGAVLLFRSVVGLKGVDPGLNPANVLTFRVSIPAARYREPARQTEFYQRAVEGVSHLPGVRSASAVSYLPFDGMAAGTGVEIEGRAPAKPGEGLVTTVRTVFPGYFRTMGIPLKSGRDFTAADNVRDEPYRFVINEAFARELLRQEQPLSARIQVHMGTENRFGDIIGVVGDVKEGSLDQDPTPTVYYNHAHLNYTSMVIVLRTAGSPMGLVEPARQVIRNLDAAQPIAQVRTMQQIVDETFSRQRFSAVLLSWFSLTALLLAAVGIYGVLAYAVTERTREIGVRVALGAQPGSILALIVGAGARLVAAGATVGVAGALALSGFLKSLLFGIGPRDPLTLAAVAVVLGCVGLLAAYVPARRASRLNPVDALRGE